jgi:hypothetical protein
MTPIGTHIAETQEVVRDLKDVIARVERVFHEYEVQGGTNYTALYNWPEAQPDYQDQGLPTKVEHDANYFAFGQLLRFIEGNFHNTNDPLVVTNYLDIFIKGS